MINHASFNQELFQFLSDSPSPFHAAQKIAEGLRTQGYEQLDEGEAWKLEAGGSYYVLRNQSSIIAFHLGEKPISETGWRMVGAHTDSPCLKLKPKSDMERRGYLLAGVEIYGGVLLSTWFDRDLSLAGRVSYSLNGELKSTLLDLKRAVGIVPNLAIHLNREVNQNRSINPQVEMPPLLLQFSEKQRTGMNALLLEELKKNSIKADRILDWELSFYDVQKPALVGWNQDFIASARLDNLLSCFVGLQSLMSMPKQHSGLLVCLDHEEIGSASFHGAAGPFLRQVLQRIEPDIENFNRALSRSYLVSTDNAHGVHPNYPEKHDEKHGPLLNQGPVIKVNSNQRYATTSETAGLFRLLAEKAETPVQEFVARADMGCGSTIGPITAANLGVRTADVGVPTFAMHSARELAGVRDAHGLYRILCEFFKRASN